MEKIIFTTASVVFFFGFNYLLFYLKKKKYSFNQRVVLSLIGGIIFGFMMEFVIGKYSGTAIYYITQLTTLVGSGYIMLLHMLVIPLILVAIISVILGFGNRDINTIKKLSIRSIGLLLLLTMFSALIAIIVGISFNVGSGLSLGGSSFTSHHNYTGIVSAILGYLPSNPFKAMSDGNAFSVVIFGLFIGISAFQLYRKYPKKVIPFKNFIDSSFEVMKWLTGNVIKLTPYGVFALMTKMVISQGNDSLKSLMIFMLAMLVAMAIVFVVHMLILASVKVNPFLYLKKGFQPLLVAATTRSSLGTMPVTVRTLKERLGVSEGTSVFTASVGSSMGMNACAGVYPAMLVVMVMIITGKPITIQIILLVMVINAVASLGVSGIPGTAIIAAGITLTSLNLPLAIIGLVIGIDPIIDMFRTLVNVNGAMTVAVVSDRSLGLFDFDKFKNSKCAKKNRSGEILKDAPIN